MAVADLFEKLRGGSVRARSLRSSGVTILDVGGANLLRLLSNLILTRLLFPEAFGLMALVQVFVYGLQMFSDIGINTMLIQHKRGAERDFRNVLWTLQIARGALLWLGACALAWPVAYIYDQPEVLWILPVIGLSLLIEGFKPTRESLANRELYLGRVVALNISAQIIGMLAMVVMAYLLQSVWALVIGTLVGATVRVILFDQFMPGMRDRFAWDWEIVKEAFSFGSFVFLSSICTFLNRMGSRLVLGAYVNMAVFGVFSIAVMLGSVPNMITQAVADKVIFPLYRMKSPRESAENRANVFRARRLVGGFAVLLSGILVMTGVWLIDLLYDPRYAQAGPMLILVACSMIPANATLGGLKALLGHGDSRGHFLMTLVTAVTKIVCLFIGVTYFGVAGAILAAGVTGLLTYPLRSWMIAKYASWDPVGELSLMAIGFAICGLACWIYWDQVVQLF